MPNSAAENPGFFEQLRRGIVAAASWCRLSWDPSSITVVMIFVSLGFWYLLLRYTSWSPALFVSLSLASFVVGALTGFMFTSYGEEQATVGKVRDWIIGGLAGLTFAKFGSLKALLLTFTSGECPQPFAMSVGVSVFFAVLGFFAMFFQRELILNVLLAKSRGERGRLDGTRAAGIVSHDLLDLLPPTILAGIEDVSDDNAVNKNPRTQVLRDRLQSDDVKTFLQQADEACQNGGALDWDVVLKAAMLNYYLIYFVDTDKKDAQRQKALEWLQRALLMNPTHADLTAKYADVLEATGSLNEAVITLERLLKSSEAPAYVQQWLGYYLLKAGRFDEAVRFSDDYHARFPDDANSLYNAANGLCQQRTSILTGPDANSPASIAEAERLRVESIKRLRAALRLEEDGKLEASKKWLLGAQGFAGLRDDPEFQQLTTATVEQAA